MELKKTAIPGRSAPRLRSIPFRVFLGSAERNEIFDSGVSMIQDGLEMLHLPRRSPTRTKSHGPGGATLRDASNKAQASIKTKDS